MSEKLECIKINDECAYLNFFSDLFKIMKKYNIKDVRGLENELKRLAVIDSQPTITGPIQEIPSDVVSKKLRAIDIIKEKKVDTIELFGGMSLTDYNDYLWNYGYADCTLNQQEYDLLSEVLL